MRHVVSGSASAVILVATVGCAAAPPPTVQSGPDAEVTVDGLYRVDNSIMPLAYVKPDLDLRRYARLMLDPVSVAYKKDPTERTSTGAGRQNFALSNTQMETLKTWFQEEAVKALTKDDGYELVDAPAPDVLRITAELVDLVVKIPTESRGGRDRSYTRSYAEVTLIVELRDSESGEILARVADRRDPAERRQDTMTYVSPAFVQADTRMLFQYWSDLLRQRIDEVRAAELP